MIPNGIFSCGQKLAPILYGKKEQKESGSVSYWKLGNSYWNQDGQKTFNPLAELSWQMHHISTAAALQIKGFCFAAKTWHNTILLWHLQLKSLFFPSYSNQTHRGILLPFMDACRAFNFPCFHWGGRKPLRHFLLHVTESHRFPRARARSFVFWEAHRSPLVSIGNFNLYQDVSIWSESHCLLCT